MISYTRNFEDVILQRVLADVPQGWYIDVGASAPAGDSNTCALYQKGWRGVAIEPLPHFPKMWRQIRPEDVFLSAAVGEQAGRTTLHVYDKYSQVSSCLSDTVDHNRQRHGVQPDRSIEVAVLTLNQVIAEHLPGRPLHLLSIDVEGMELQVLRGLDLTRHRPWVLVLEAVLPGTQTPNHQAWEPYLLAANYWMAYFDGANRFYLAQEQRHLLGRFALPPNVWDNFVPAAQYQMREQIAQLQAEIRKLKAELAAR